MAELPLRASNVDALIVRVPRAARLPNPFLLLNRGEQPLSILVSHECPYFAGLGRRLLAAFDEIARFSLLLRQGDLDRRYDALRDDRASLECP